MALRRGRHKGSTESHGSQLCPGPHTGAWAPDRPSAALPPLAPDYVWVTPLHWRKFCRLSDLGVAELCSFQLFSKQSKYVTDGGGSCLKTPSEAGIECLGGVTALSGGPHWRGWSDGENQASFQRASDSRTFLPLHSQSQTPGLGQPERSERKGQRGRSFNPLALLM